MHLLSGVLSDMNLLALVKQTGMATPTGRAWGGGVHIVPVGMINGGEMRGWTTRTTRLIYPQCCGKRE